MTETGRKIDIKGTPFFFGNMVGVLTEEQKAHIDSIELNNGVPVSEKHKAFINMLAYNVKRNPYIPLPILLNIMLQTGGKRIERIELFQNQTQ